MIYVLSRRIIYAFTRVLRKSETLQWRHNECHGISNHQYFDCLILISVLIIPETQNALSHETDDVFCAFAWDLICFNSHTHTHTGKH